MKGHQNFKDGRWDIPITKSKITKKCCLTPNIHPGIYPITANISPPTKPNTPTKSIPKPSDLPIHLKNLGNLVDYNDFNNTIDEQTKLITDTNINHKANIIIR